MCHPRLTRRPPHRTAELPLFHRHGRQAEEGEARRPDRECCAARYAAAHHGHAEEGRGGRNLGSHPVRECRSEAAYAGEGRDGALHGRGRARLRRGAHAGSAVKVGWHLARSTTILAKRPHDQVLDLRVLACPGGPSENVAPELPQRSSTRASPTGSKSTGLASKASS